MASARRIRPNTLTGYRTIAERHLIPVLGTMRLEAIRERHVQAWLDGLTVSEQYVAHCRAFLRRVLNVAVRGRVIARNPALAVELPKVPQYRAKPLTAEDVRALLAVPDRLAAFWRLALVTGFREGELLALGWDDIDLEQGTVRVTTQLSRLNGEWVRTATKAARRLDTVAIDADTVRALEAHRIRQAAERTPDWAYWGHVFVTPTGRPYHRKEVSDAFRLACDRAGIARRRVHDLRGSSATLLHDIGVAEDVRQARLGHSSKAMARHYAKASVAQDRDAVERLAEAIR